MGPHPGTVRGDGEALAYLSERGIDMSGEPRTETKTALEFFSYELAKSNAGAGTR